MSRDTSLLRGVEAVCMRYWTLSGLQSYNILFPYLILLGNPSYCSLWPYACMHRNTVEQRLFQHGMHGMGQGISSIWDGIVPINAMRGW